MRSITMAALIGLLGALAIGSTALAHHAFTAEFDGNKPVAFTGIVTKIDWVNPHSWLYIDVKGSDGKVTNWALELGAPNALFRRGWRMNSIPVGGEVKVTGFQCKSGKPCANGRTVTLPDGREFFAGSSGTGAPSDGADPTTKK